ncbi:MAG TPA: ABC transporter ATP-binding protein, partial [Acholeplasmataceae bacterium]|nr:ABC transporter ATP-binding protein [Acholeplasmataceae bacterium]
AYFDQAISLGDVSFYIAAIIALSTALRGISGLLTEMNTNARLSDDYFDYLDDQSLFTLQGDRKAIPQEETLEIEFRNVTFTYPRSEQVILDGISFKINKGEKISIVGLNGAGKTTFVKLLCRLYRPKSGEILVNGRSIYEYDYESYLRQISAVFQDFKLFSYSLKENILNEDGDEEEAYKVACKVGLKEKIDSLPEGINSLYSKIFDEKGIELSGGEAQKVAIARALHKNASLVILDEPTSALDPIAEAEIYMHFNELVEEKTAIYISHRMSSSVFCDRIIVIDSGKISAIAPHAELMKDTEGLYYKLFMTQAQNYQE